MIARHLPVMAALLAWTAAASAQVVVVDNSDANGFTVLSGTWTANTAVSGCYGSDYLLCRTVSAGAPRSEVEWRPALTTGDHQVFVYYLGGSTRASDARFMVHHAAGSTFVLVNQQVSGSQWVSLGVFPFQAGSAGCVRLTNAASSTYVVADAVKFVDLSQIQPLAPTDARLQIEGALFNMLDLPSIVLRRFSETVLAASTDTYSAGTAKTASGIGVRIRTDSPWVRATFRQASGAWGAGQFAAYQDDVPASVGGPLDIETVSQHPGQPVTYRIICPPYESLAFAGLEIQAGATIYPLSECRPRYAAFGDSISHGSGMLCSDQTYPWLLAEAKDWQVFNFGVGGSKVTPSFGSMLDNEFIDVATVLWGQNDLGYNDVALYASRYEEFLTNLRRCHPKTTIYCMTLTATAGTETPLRAQYRQAVRDIVTARSAAADAHIHVIEGLDVSTPADLRDGAHLSATGAANVADRLAATIHYPGGSGVFLDFDRDCDVDETDFDAFAGCVRGPANTLEAGCEDKDFDWDGDVDQSDFGVFQRCLTVPGAPVIRDCVD